MEEKPSHKALGEFLRTRRERLTPQEVGLASYGPRRTSGLRREEVAQLAHMGTSWYTSLEQGRRINPSEDILNNIAKALRLTESERTHLHLLARPAQEDKVELQQLNVGLEHMVRALEPNPAFVLGRYWDLLFWNKAAEFVFHFPAYSPQLLPKPNYMRLFLTDNKLGIGREDWEAKIKIMIARFRVDYGHFPNDPGFMELIAEFNRISPLFRESWPDHDVQDVTDCHKQWYDTRIGEMEFEHVALQPSIHPELKVMVYTASADTAERLGNQLGAVKM